MLLSLKNRHRLLYACMLLLFISFILSGCQQTEKEVVVIDVTDEEMESINDAIDNMPKRPPGTPPVMLAPEGMPAKDLAPQGLVQIGIITGENIDSLRLPVGDYLSTTQMKDLELQIIDKRQVLLETMVNGNLDAAIVSADLAAELYNKSEGKIKIAGQNVDVVINIIKNGQDLWSLEDLRGKTLYYSNESLPSREILNVILMRNKIKRLNEKDLVKVDNFVELLKNVVANTGSLGLVLGDNALAATMKNTDIEIAFDLSEKWKEVTGTNLLPVRCLVIKEGIAEAQLKRLQFFLTDETLQASWRSPRGYEKDILAFLRMIHRQSPELIGGEIPSEDIFFKWQPAE